MRDWATAASDLFATGEKTTEASPGTAISHARPLSTLLQSVHKALIDLSRVYTDLTVSLSHLGTVRNTESWNHPFQSVVTTTLSLYNASNDMLATRPGLCARLRVALPGGP
jgi:hypothetical protein